MEELLLADLEKVFAGEERLYTEKILNRLVEMDEGAWEDFRYGKGPNAHWLAGQVAAYGIRSQQMRLDGQNKKGYSRADLEPVFLRYLRDTPRRREELAGYARGLKQQKVLTPGEHLSATFSRKTQPQAEFTNAELIEKYFPYLEGELPDVTD